MTDEQFEKIHKQLKSINSNLGCVVVLMIMLVFLALAAAGYTQKLNRFFERGGGDPAIEHGKSKQ